MNHNPLNPWWPYHPRAQGALGLALFSQLALAFVAEVGIIPFGLGDEVGATDTVFWLVCGVATYIAVTAIRFFLWVMPRMIDDARTTSPLALPEDRVHDPRRE